ncbi:class I SAM-dependent methyltransferase [Oxalobacteraceae bacterium R-40]|uniref:Class I SAM-dependent methyltransferase n=1 Tax=Keguizhuia sedimenti TaxID=3064264 RepID=A0ABU1BTX2_9BURK|nr:class I SAM-dependent methyltransferase [Oxalobacteraceae bacterium R-40]
MSIHDHWNRVYRTKQPDEVSWYAPHLERSLNLVMQAAPNKDAYIIDIGGGEATLVDDLVNQGYRHVSVLDISEAALKVAQNRLQDRRSAVNWITGDITNIELPVSTFDVWHDRAVFHFLTDQRQRAAYVEQVKKAVKHGGHVIVATFGPNGPLQCSGLDVVRYDANELHAQFGGAFELVSHEEENHCTPWGAMQQFVYCYCKYAA